MTDAAIVGEQYQSCRFRTTQSYERRRRTTFIGSVSLVLVYEVPM